MAENITIARPYAQAVFEVAKESGKLKEWSSMLQLISAVVANDDFSAFIGDPRLGRESVTQLILDVCGEEKLTTAGKNLVKILSENDRLSVMGELVSLYEEYRSEEESTLTAEVVSAFELSDKEQGSIVSSLKETLGRDVKLNCEVDKELIAGAVIRAGDLVIDGSATGQLAKLTTAITR